MFATFSTTASAEAVTTKPYYVYAVGSGLYSGDFSATIDDMSVGYSSYTGGYVISQPFTYNVSLSFGYDDKSNILTKGDTYNINIENLYVTGYVKELEQVSFPSAVSGYVTYNDNTRDYFTVDKVQRNTGAIDVSFQVDASKDVRLFTLLIDITLPHTATPSTSIQTTIGGSLFNSVIKIDKVDKSEGLLGGILGKITELWQTAESGFANMVKGITELPQKLWDLISDGLKNLFVPDEEYMAEYKDKWDTLLSERLGAVYQVCDIVVNSWDNIMAADETNTIEIPEVTINVGTPFTFGGYTVQIVPDGFNLLVNALKLIISIVCTYTFVNGLLKRYDEVMGVEQ